MRSLLPILSLSIALNCLCAAAWAQSPSEGENTAPTAETEPEAKSTDSAETAAPTPTLADKLLAPEPSATGTSDGPLKRSKRWHERRFPTSSGAIGIDRTMTAEVGVVDTFRWLYDSLGLGVPLSLGGAPGICHAILCLEESSRKTYGGNREERT